MGKSRTKIGKIVLADFLCVAAAIAVAVAANGVGDALAGTRHVHSRVRLGVDLDDEGFRFVDPTSGHTSPVPFGSSSSGTQNALTSAFARPGHRNHLSNCGAGPMDEIAWPNGLAILVANGRFVGWEARSRGVTTMDDIGVGTTRRMLERSAVIHVEQSTLGTQFTIGSSSQGIGGLLSGRSPTARITRLWAGVTCHFG